MIRWVPRENPGMKTSALVTAGSLGAGLVAVGLLFAFSGVNPFFAFYKIFAGSFGSLYGLGETLTKATPLLLVAVGLSIPYRGKFWNIGAESQILMGALAAVTMGLFVFPGLPAPLFITGLFLTGALAGGLWGVIPAVLKIRLGVNEVISTLMLNYVAAKIVEFLVNNGPLTGKSKRGYPYTDDLLPQSSLPLIPGTRIHWITLVLGILAAVAVFFLLRQSKLGYEIRVSGENREAARYAGIDFLKVSVVSMALSGALAGLAGVGELAGIHHHLGDPGSLSSGYGFTAIIVVWLARLNPLGILLSAFLMAGILVGGDAIQLSLKLPAVTVQVVNGLFLLFLIAGEFFLNNKPVLTSRQKEA